MQIKLKFKWKVKRFFLLLTCQVFKVQGSVFLFQHLPAETPRVEWRDFLLTLALFIISEVSTNVFNTTQGTQTGVPAPTNLQSEVLSLFCFGVSPQISTGYQVSPIHLPPADFHCF